MKSLENIFFENLKYKKNKKSDENENCFKKSLQNQENKFLRQYNTF